MFFNTNKEKNKNVRTTHEGGVGYHSTFAEYVSLLANGLGNSFYEPSDQRVARLIEVTNEVAKIDPAFAAKALIYSRTVFGQRTSTALAAAVLVRHLSGLSYSAKFFGSTQNGGVVRRLDDMLEILSAYWKLTSNAPIPNSMRKGFKSILETSDKYQIAKYIKSNKSISLIDLVNLVRPNPSKEMAQVFADLMSGNLSQFGTVESENTKAGQTVAAKVLAGEISGDDADSLLADLKLENYSELVRQNKIGYLALLRNLRNILKLGDQSLIDVVCKSLTSKPFIKSSLVTPYQIDTALEVILAEFQNTEGFKVVNALTEAYDLSCTNLSETFKGNTAVVFDTSGSMSDPMTFKVGNRTLSSNNLEKATLVSATLAKGINADVYHFASSCVRVKYNPNDSVNTLKNSFQALQGKVGHGTEFSTIFDTIGKSGIKYDRIFIISDMQGSDLYLSRGKQYPDTFIYSIDISGHESSTLKPDSKLCRLYGYNSDIYDKIKVAELDVDVVFSEINAIPL